MIKTIALAFFVLTSLALGGLVVRARQQTAQQTVHLAALQEQVDRQHAEIQKAAAAAAESEQKRQQQAARNRTTKHALLEALNTATATPPPTADASSTPPNSDEKKKKPGNPFAESIAKMMKDPAMKNMMRTTQATVLKQMYGDLVKQWSLTPDETQTFYDLLLDKQMNQMDQGMKLLEKGPDGAPIPSVADQDAKIKASLGDNLYKQYQDYEKTLSGRLTVNQFQQQLATSNTPVLTPDQSAVLLQTITEENANRPPGSSGSSLMGKNGSFSMDPAQTDQIFKSQSDLDARVDARMENTLSTDQLRVLKEQQQQSLATQRMGMEMASKMMGPSPTP